MYIFVDILIILEAIGADVVGVEQRLGELEPGEIEIMVAMRAAAHEVGDQRPGHVASPCI